MRSFAHEVIRADTLDAEFYRERSAFCHQLAAASAPARLLSERLQALAKAYEHRALVAALDGKQAINDDDDMATAEAENTSATPLEIAEPTNAT
jgi:hypothetical protein